MLANPSKVSHGQQTRLLVARSGRCTYFSVTPQANLPVHIDIAKG
jgi:hypothetical protein